MRQIVRNLFVWACAGGVIGLAGCGDAGTLAGLSDGPDASAVRSSSLTGTDGAPALVLEIVTDGAWLSESLPRADLSAGDLLPGLDAATLGLDADDRVDLIARTVAYVDAAFAPFGLMTVSDTLDADSLDERTEVISRVLVTQMPGVPEHCGCQGMTPALGLPVSGSAEAVVFANAFSDNGLVDALAGLPWDERIERLAVALSNSIVHEAGHTLGLVHVDVVGPPRYFMARGGSASRKLSLADMTTPQVFSQDALPVTADALGVRDAQCDACIIRQTLATRRAQMTPPAIDVDPVDASGVAFSNPVRR